jgi:hypothetical protein
MKRISASLLSILFICNSALSDGEYFNAGYNSWNSNHNEKLDDEANKPYWNKEQSTFDNSSSTSYNYRQYLRDPSSGFKSPYNQVAPHLEDTSSKSTFPRNVTSEPMAPNNLPPRPDPSPIVSPRDPITQSDQFILNNHYKDFQHNIIFPNSISNHTFSPNIPSFNNISPNYDRNNPNNPSYNIIIK